MIRTAVATTVAAAAVATATVAAVATTTVAAVAATATALAPPLAAGLLDANRAAKDLLALHLLDGVLSVARVLEGHKGETYRGAMKKLVARGCEL